MNKIVEIAYKELGTTESPKNSNKTKYGKWFGWDGVAWCGIFVSYCYHKAGNPLTGVGFSKGFAGCQTAVAYYKKNNKIVSIPKEGDIVFFDWNNDGRYDHTGIFISHLSGNEFQSIEGNTSLTNQSNGGNVMLRTRNYNTAIFVRP